MVLGGEGYDPSSFCLGGRVHGVLVKDLAGHEDRRQGIDFIRHSKLALTCEDHIATITVLIN